MIIALMLVVGCSANQKNKVCADVEKAHAASEDVYVAAHAACIAPTSALGGIVQ